MEAEWGTGNRNEAEKALLRR